MSCSANDKPVLMCAAAPTVTVNIDRLQFMNTSASYLSGDVFCESSRISPVIFYMGAVYCSDELNPGRRSEVCCRRQTRVFIRAPFNKV